MLAGKGSDVWSVTPSTTVYRVLEEMAAKGVGALLVMDGDHLAGIVSERDYARKVILLDRVSKNTLVAEIMTTDVHTVTVESSVAECMELMTEHRIRHLPVLEGPTVVGIVSIGDIVKAVIGEQRFLIEQLESYIST